jgi:hypothetical protein
MLSLLGFIILLRRYALGGLEDIPLRSEFQGGDTQVPQVASKIANKVVMVTAASREKLVDFQDIDNFYQKTWDNRMSYAEAHGNYFCKLIDIGYAFMLLDSNKFEVSREKHPVWCKIPAIAEALDAYPAAEWVWWLDLDAIIMTPHLDLYEYVLNSTAMKMRLLDGKTIIPNGRIAINNKPLPTLNTGQVPHLSTS